MSNCVQRCALNTAIKPRDDDNDALALNTAIKPRDDDNDALSTLPSSHETTTTMRSQLALLASLHLVRTIDDRVCAVDVHSSASHCRKLRFTPHSHKPGAVRSGDDRPPHHRDWPRIRPHARRRLVAACVCVCVHHTLASLEPALSRGQHMPANVVQLWTADSQGLRELCPSLCP
jgi:hypothetical protein